MQLNAFVRFLVIAIYILLCKSYGIECSEDETVLVKISAGPIKGLAFTSQWTNETIYSFRGIPYASPPVGNLRFKSPVAPDKWTEVKDCTSERSYCYQPEDTFSSNLKTQGDNTLSSTAEMSEDCLFLNVYTPNMQPQNPFPVLVWVHGGAFTSGSGNYNYSGPDFLLAEGLVVVTMNYRLGAFGFFTLGSAEAPGNYGLKDQLFALKWVQSEIKNFGGDPNQVTLFGQSSGSASVHLHYLSPLSVGLFHRVIADSGPGLASWAARGDESWYGQQLASFANCLTTNNSAMLNCLMGLSADDLLAAQVLVPPNPEDDTKAITVRFIPTEDSWSSESFLPETPEQLMKKKRGSCVPILMGTLTDEASINLLAMNETQIQNTTNNLEMYIPVDTRKISSASQLKALVKRVDEFYFNGSTPSFTNLKGFLELATDAWFAYFTAVSARYYRERADVYLYYFTFDGSFKDPTTLYFENNLNIDLVAHAEELNYIFVIERVNQTASEDSHEMKNLRRMVRMWSNFAKYGVPANGSDPVLQNVTWLPVNKTATRHLHIDVDLTMVHDDYLAERVAFWDSITSTSSADKIEVTFLTFMCVFVMFCLK